MCIWVPRRLSVLLSLSFFSVFTVCYESPCGEGESCGVQAGSYVCVNCSTSEERQDNRCSHLTLNPCIFGPCANGGRCELRSNNTFACTCPPGYSGTTCEASGKKYCMEFVCHNVLWVIYVRVHLMYPKLKQISSQYFIQGVKQGTS